MISFICPLHRTATKIPPDTGEGGERRETRKTFWKRWHFSSQGKRWNAGEVIISDFEMYHKATVIKHSGTNIKSDIWASEIE